MPKTFSFPFGFTYKNIYFKNVHLTRTVSKFLTLFLNVIFHVHWIFILRIMFSLAIVVVCFCEHSLSSIFIHYDLTTSIRVKIQFFLFFTVHTRN